MPPEPTNLDLKESFDRHSADDRLFQEAQGLVNAETAKSLASVHERMSALATKDDIGDLKEFMSNINIGLGIVKFTWNNAGKIGSVILFLGGAYLVLKYGVVGGLMWLTSRGLL